MFGMKKKEMTNLLEERAERILLLERRLESKNETLDGYRAREQSIVESLTSSQAEARERIAAAQTRADALTKSVEEQAARIMAEAETHAQSAISSAQARSDELLLKAQAQAEQTVSNAEAKARQTLAEAAARAERTLAEARAQSEQLRMQARQERDACETLAARYRAVIGKTAAQAMQSAHAFAAFVEECGAQLADCAKEEPQPENVPFAEGFSENAPLQKLQGEPEQAPVLQDAAGDPAKLMHNIYTLQNRDLPESVRSEADKCDGNDAFAAPDEPFEEELPDLAPRPEAEWQPEDEEGAAIEWQPELEPELEIPTVSELMPDEPAGSDDELSLDALLDEIIRAGD